MKANRVKQVLSLFTVEEIKWYILESLRWLEIYEAEGFEYSAMLERNSLTQWVKMLEEVQVS